MRPSLLNPTFPAMLTSLLEQKRRTKASRKRRRNEAEEIVDASEIPQPAAVPPEEARKNRLEAALWAAKHNWDEFGNPVDAPTEPREYVAEVQGNAESEKTFLWPKIKT